MARKMIKGLGHLCSEERLREQGLFRVQKTQLAWDLIKCGKISEGRVQKDRSRLSSEVPSDRTRSNRHNTSGTTHETQAVPSEHRKLFNC